MKKSIPDRLRRVALIVAWLAVLASGRLWGQGSFTLSVSDSPDPVEANQPLTYLINLTNQSGIGLSSVFVTNRFSGPVQLIGITNSRSGTVLTTTNSVIFVIDSFPGAGDGRTNLMSLVVRPTAFGSLTNAITIATFNLNVTNATTNVVTQVIAGQPDLAIAIRGPTQPVLVNDWMTYTLAASNVGSDAALAVVVSNGLPADVEIIGFAPSNHVFTVTNNVLRWEVGRLGIGDFSELAVTIQPTNAGILTNFAAVSAAAVLDTNTVNNAASTNILVGQPLGSLVASTNSPMVFNPQTGLMEQTVRLMNVGTNSVPSARIIVSGLTNRLFSAVGTNDGNPFVVHAATLETNQSVDLLFEYFVPTRMAVVVSNSQLHPFGMPEFNLAPPAGTPLPFPAPRLVLLPGKVLLEFPSVPGRTYTVLYRNNSILGNDWAAAQPSILAPADRVQWIDNGPPKTISPPASVGARFYRVIENP